VVEYACQWFQYLGVHVSLKKCIISVPNRNLIYSFKQRMLIVQLIIIIIIIIIYRESIVLLHCNVIVFILKQKLQVRTMLPHYMIC
jgi:hypothetical protein